MQLTGASRILIIDGKAGRADQQNSLPSSLHITPHLPPSDCVTAHCSSILRIPPHHSTPLSSTRTIICIIAHPPVLPLLSGCHDNDLTIARHAKSRPSGRLFLF